MMNLLELSKATACRRKTFAGSCTTATTVSFFMNWHRSTPKPRPNCLPNMPFVPLPIRQKSSTPVSPAPALTVSASGPRPFSFCAAFQITMCSSTPVACFTPVSFPFTRSIVKRSPAPSAFLMW